MVIKKTYFGHHRGGSFVIRKNYYLVRIFFFSMYLYLHQATRRLILSFIRVKYMKREREILIHGLGERSMDRREDRFTYSIV